MCDQHGCYGGYCDPEEVTVEDQETFLKEREAILEAKLATIRHLRETLKDKSKSDKK